MSLLRKILSSPTIVRASVKKPKFVRCASSASPNVIESGLPDVAIPRLTIPEFVFAECGKFEPFTAIECGQTGRKYTYGELIKKSKNLSKALRKKLGLGDGDVVAILLPNIPEYPVATLGILHANLTVTTLNPVYTPEEIQRQLSDSGAKAIITLVSLWDTAIASCQLLKKPLPTLVIKTAQTQSIPAGAIDFKEFTDNVIDLPDPAPGNCEDVAFLPYSSGTTGLPKGVQLTHYNIVANLTQNDSHEIPFLIETTQSHQDVIPVILPMFHIYGFTVNTMSTLTQGARMVTLSKFTPEDYVHVLRRDKANVLFLVPPIVLFLSIHPMVKREDLDPVRVCLSGAAPLGALDEQRFTEKAAKSIHMLQGYGLTESSPGVAVTTIKLKSEVNVVGSVGRPLPNTLVKTVAVDDPTGTPLGPNSTGELLVKGPQVMKGYLNKPEDTKDAFLDGWLRTGDVGYYNQDRVFFITDRLKELIKVKGFQVAPAELEEIIRDFPNVDDAAVIGIPHPSQGEAPRAYIVPKKNTKVNTKDLEDYVKNKVAHYKQLKGGVEIVESIPKNASGKIMRRSLKLQYENTEK